MNNNFIISLHKDKQSVYIILYNSYTTLDCNTIHNTILESLQDNATYKDISLQDLYSYEIYVFLDSILLAGSKESPNNPLYFGSIDSKGEFIESKPVYYLIGESNYDTKDSKETFTQTLQVFLGSNTLTLLNYSLLDSSLNIKLECSSKESKEILEKEQTQMDCHDLLRKSRNDKINRNKDSRNDDINNLTSNDNSQSTAMLHPVLEDNEIKCPHGGVVKLKSNKGKSFKSKDVPMILESDLLNSQIIGCTNNILGVPTPCTLVSVILPSARALKKYNDDYPIMQDLVSSGCLSDKGFPLIATPKPNTFKINSPSPMQANTQSKESIESSLHLTKPILRLHYKVNKYQKDNLPIYKIKLQDEIIESSSDMPLDSLMIDVKQDCKDIEDKVLQTSLLASYPKDYTFKQVDLQLDSNALILIFLIPQKIPKIYKEAYKQYQDKDYGVGKYKYLYEYCHHKDLDIEDYSQMGLDKKASSQYQFVLLTPAKANKILVEFANGLDSIIESKDREQCLETLLTLKLINGGYKEKYWNFEEKRIEEYAQETTYKESKDSRATQENKHKQILEMYFSYGEECERLQEDSRHSSDVNLHIITQGYGNGEGSGAAYQN